MMPEEAQYAEDEAATRSLSYLQALVEHREIPIYSSNERDRKNVNISMVQAMDDTDLKNIVLLTAPAPVRAPQGEEESKAKP